ncbi:MAG TPA: Hsp33 family molecular chaperone HslO [Anaerolineae bacterium]|jgi:molecular chaperone Hsp33|nr:Hsp33 family molecular chaperone HslO [Anaerolineae bacterium]
MQDHIVRATAASSMIRAIAAVTTDTIEEARRRQDTYPTATAALGRVMTGAALIASTLKDGNKVTVQIKGDGPLREVTGDADAKGNVRGYVGRPHIHLPSRAGKLDVGRAVGTNGILSVVKDVGLREPYRGIVPLVSGEVGEDISYYYASSEQQPSAVALGVLVVPDNSVAAAGGYIVQPLVGADDRVLSKVEENISKIPPVSDMVNIGLNAEEMLQNALEGLDIEFEEKQDLQFTCGCSRERAERTLIVLGVREVKEMILEGKNVELTCNFCGESYIFSIEDLHRVLEEIKERSGLKVVTDDGS